MSRSLVLALGTFDGLHLGHRALIDRTLELAREKAASPACYTFNNVPATFSLGLSNIQLMSREHKEAMLKSMGIEVLMMRDFDLKLMATDPEDFVRDLVQSYDISQMVVGKDFHFGSKGRGTSLYLKSLGALYGYETEIIDFVFDEEGKLSSSRLRARLREGNMEAVRHILGRNYSFFASVVRAEAGTAFVMRPNFEATPVRQSLYRALLVGEGFRKELVVRLVPSTAPAMWQAEFSYDGAEHLVGQVCELELIEELDEAYMSLEEAGDEGCCTKG